MLDRNYIKQNKQEVQDNCKNRGINVNIDELLELDEKRITVLKQVEEIRAEKKSHSKTKPTPEVIKQLQDLSQKQKDLEASLKEYDDKVEAIMKLLPNISWEHAPIGPDEESNEVVRTVGEKPEFDFEPQEHHVLGENLNIIDISTAADVSGARFAYLKGDLALMQFALVNHAFATVTNLELLEKIAKDNNLDIDVTTFMPIVPPTMVRPEVMDKMGRLEPRDERYHIQSDDLYLVGSAEHTLGPMHMGQTFAQNELPVRYIGYSTAYRREAGSYGKDTKGIFRLHQFDKLEIETYVTQENGMQEQDFIIAIQEYLMQSLGLPYQVVLKSTGDMGQPDYREYDIETWLPGQGKYRETHTSDFMTDFQSRRLNIKYKTPEGENKLVYMNDATVFAIGRTLIAIMENYQNKDGSISIPDVLQKYMNGKKTISK